MILIQRIDCSFLISNTYPAKLTPAIPLPARLSYLSNSQKRP